jgi:SPP1 gp7 family putative phage head morphogenesis protein
MAKPIKTARPVHANRGIEAAYRRRIQSLVTEMAASYQYWIKAAMRENPPKMAAVVEAAEDASPSDKITRRVRELARRWQEKFDEEAPRIAASYVTKMFRATDSAMRASMKAAGWAVDFTMTPAVRDAFDASVAENVSLIKSIPSQYHTQVEGSVMRGYAAGRDLQAMTKDLRALYPKASKRVTLIARDQSNKANAVVNRARQLELGITEAIWMHSSAGKEPRPDHVAANGKKYKIAEGCKISGEYIQPGQMINCRCTSRPVLPF